MEIFDFDKISFLLKLLSIPAALKIYIFVQSLRIYGVYNLYNRRDVIFKHSIFNKLDRLYTDQELFNLVPDHVRREIFKDIFKIEVQGINEILLSLRDYIYTYNSFIKFMLYHRYLDTTSLIDFYFRLYNAHRDKLERKIRIKLSRGGLDHQKVVFLIQKFYEFTDENSFNFREKIEVLKKRNNLYYSVVDLLDLIEIEIETEKKFLPLKFIKLNGKLDGLNYKGHESINETKAKLHALESATAHLDESEERN